MDFFWLIPLAAIVVPLIWGLYLLVQRQQVASPEPRVLLHKEADKPDIDEKTLARDWQKRPVASYLDEMAGRDPSQK